MTQLKTHIPASRLWEKASYPQEAEYLLEYEHFLETEYTPRTLQTEQG
jgi:hypothetical protein